MQIILKKDVANLGYAGDVVTVKTGYGVNYLIEFKANPEFIATLETQYHRDERVIRFLTVALDKDAVAYAEKRRANKAAKAAQNAE